MIPKPHPGVAPGGWGGWRLFSRLTDEVSNDLGQQKGEHKAPPLFDFHRLLVGALVLLSVAIPVRRAPDDSAVGLLDRLRLDVLIHHLVLRVNQRLVLYPLNGTVERRLRGQSIASTGCVMQAS